MLPPYGIDPAGASRFPFERDAFEPSRNKLAEGLGTVFHLAGEEMGADCSDVHLERLAERIPPSASCVVVDSERSSARTALRFANACTKPVWLRRSKGGDAMYLPLAQFNRFFPSVDAAAVPQASPCKDKGIEHAFDDDTLRSIAAGSLHPQMMGSYSRRDLHLLDALIGADVRTICIHDQDCPALFAQSLADLNGKLTIVWHHDGQRLYVPRSAAARLLPLGGGALNGVRTVETGHGYELDAAGMGANSAERIRVGRLTAAELGDRSNGMAVALSVLIPANVKEIRILGGDCSERFARALANAAKIPVHVGEVLLEPDGGQSDGVSPSGLHALPAGPRVAAASREDKAWLLFVLQGRLLQEDLQGYVMRCLERLVAALDSGLRRIEVLDPECPAAFLHALADAAGKPVLHDDLVYLPQAIDSRPMPNPVASDTPTYARNARLQEQLRREGMAAGTISGLFVKGMAPEALAELAVVVEPGRRRPFVGQEVDRETAQRLCNALGTMLRWGDEYLTPDPLGHCRFDSSVLVADDVGLIGGSDYRQHMEDIAAHYAAQGVPVKFELLAQEDGKPPAMHLQIGSGKRHHLNTSAVHPNETHAWLADVHDAEWWCRNAYLLEENDLTIHYYAFASEATELSEPGLTGRPDQHVYAQHMVRSQVTTAYPANGFAYAEGDFSFEPDDPSVLAFCALIDGILALGHRILSAHSGHNAPMQLVPAAFMLLGQQIDRLAALATRLESMAQKQGFDVFEIPAPEGQEPIPGARITFQAMRAAGLYAAGSPIGLSEIEYIEDKVLESEQPHFIGLKAELARWQPHELFHLTEGEVAKRSQRILARLPALMQEAGEWLLERVRQEPALRGNVVVDAALAVTGQTEEPVWGCYAPPPVAADPSAAVPPLQAVCRLIVSPFHTATRAGQVVSALAQCGNAELSKKLNASMHGVIDEVFRLGRVKDVPLEDAIRAFLKARSLLMQEALEKEEMVAVPV